MIVICNGMPRSASTWSFNVVLGLLRRSYPYGDLVFGYDESVEHFLSSVPAGAEHAVVKCHELDERGQSLSRSGEARTIYTWRNPADAVVSCMRMFDQDFDEALHAVGASLQLHRFHQAGRVALILDYPALTADPTAGIEGIAAYLGLGPDQRTVSAVAPETSVERMQDRIAELPDAAELTRRCGYPHDPTTLLHPGHIRDGRSGHGQDALTAEQISRVEGLC